MGLDLVPTITKYVIILTVQGYQYIGVNEYDTPQECYRSAIQQTLNTTIQADCIPNLKDTSPSSSPNSEESDPQ